MDANEPTFDAIERTMRRRRFGTLGTTTKDGRPHATGVVYAVSPPGEPLRLYVTTNVRNKEANIRPNNDVAVVVPPSRPA